MTEKEVQRLLKLELENGLDDIKIDGIPIWRIVRFSTRIKYLKKKGIYANKTKKNKINIIQLLKDYWCSRKEIKKLLKSNREIQNVIMAFPRLTKIVEEGYLDRFTDPVIQKTSIKKSYIIFQRHLSGHRLSPRFDHTNVVHTNWIDYSSKLLSFLVVFKFVFKYKKEIAVLFESAKDIFELTVKDKLIISLEISNFFIAKRLYENILKKINPSNVFTVNRSVFSSVIAGANKMGLKTYEFQHGVTLNDTVLYSGVYNSEIDPNYFLAFGENSKAEFFYVPKDRLVNIGFGFIPFLRDRMKKEKKSKNSILFVSAPFCTQKIFLLIDEVAANLNKYDFVIRLHPQEGLNEEQQNIVEKHENLSLDDSTIDSFVSLMDYNKIIGDISTVLYEALSLNKSVAKLNFSGFSNPPKEDDGFTYISSFEELVSFIENEREYQNNDKTYSNFDAEILEKLIQ